MAAPPADLQRVVWWLGLGLPPLEHCHRLYMQQWRWQAVRQWLRMQHGHCSHQERLQQGDNEATIAGDGPTVWDSCSLALEASAGAGEDWSRTDCCCVEESWTPATHVEQEVAGIEGGRMSG